MKKLKLKLDDREKLSKEQMKKISGGYIMCKLYPTNNTTFDCPTTWWWQLCVGNDEIACYNEIGAICGNDACCDHIDC